MNTDSSNFNTLIEWPLSKHIDQEYLPFIEDALRLIILQMAVQFMFYARSPYDTVFFSIEFFELVIYSIIGLSVYWLLFKKLIKIT